jgi:predicted outer membrane repeat protein
VYTDTNTVLTVSNSTFHANSAVDIGSSIDAAGTTTITNCHFSDHTAKFGAALAIETNITATISGCSFNNNNASTSAGVLYIAASCEVTVSDCVFSNNTATNYGGSILAYTKSTVNITASSFTGGSAAVGGALATFTETDITLRDVHMSSHAAVNGGAMNIQALMHVYGSSFSNNTAQSRGGLLVGETSSAIEMHNSSMNANACQGKCSDNFLLSMLLHDTDDYFRATNSCTNLTLIPQL